MHQANHTFRSDVYLEQARRLRSGRIGGQGSPVLTTTRPWMAKLKCAAVAAGLLFGIAGCQSASTSSMVQLPRQDFGGPSNTWNAPPRTPVAQTPRPKTQKPLAYNKSVPQAWIPTAPPTQWKWIVIHHSATTYGSAAIIDKWHRQKGWDEIGYHFVIGNGTQTGNGVVEVSSRWPVQKHGAHAKTPDNRFNRFGIGICMIGNFDHTRPTAAQMQAVTKLVAHLMKTYHIPASRVIGHQDTKSTECPGRYVSLAEIRRQSLRVLADSGETPIAEPQIAASLLHPIGSQPAH